jgi:hypothetical protein
MLKRLAILAAFLLGASAALAGGIPTMPSTPQFSEPSQIVGTINAFINQLSSGPGYTGTPQITGVGGYCGASGTTPQTCNGMRGQVAWTTAPPTTTGSTVTYVINNSLVTAASNCFAQWNTAGTAGSALVVGTVTPTAGVLTIVTSNAGTTTNAVATGTLGFHCVN